MKEQFMSQNKNTLSYIILGFLVIALILNDVFLALGSMAVMIPLLLATAIILKFIAFFLIWLLLGRQRNLAIENVLCPLTRIYNRRYFFERLEERLVNSNRSKEKSVSIIMFDLDDFKQVNDTQGHYTGDQVLIEVSNAVKTIIRQNDIFARLGGEEFILCLPETALGAAEMIAERIRASIELLTRKPYSVSVSVGVAQWDETETADQLYTRVDHLTYASKRRGKNTVTTQTDDISMLFG